MSPLHLSKDRKVSPRGIYQENFRDGAGRWIPTIPNSFGLPAGDSCPGRTPFCKSCYAVISEQAERVGDAVRRNLELLQEAGTVHAMTELLGEMMSRYLEVADRKKIAAKDRIFRIHWDGDFFSIDYAKAWVRVIRATPQVQFWAYTRSFVHPVNVVPVLEGVDNLELYLSADEWNIEYARSVVDEFPSVHLAICTADYRTGRALAGDRKAIVCPENAERMPLMSKDGRGACVDCRLCVVGRADVLFSTSHREDATAVPAPRIRRSREGAVA